jgi:hypothetical protein
MPHLEKNLTLCVPVSGVEGSVALELLSRLGCLVRARYPMKCIAGARKQAKGGWALTSIDQLTLHIKFRVVAN